MSHLSSLPSPMSGISYQPKPNRSEMAREPEGVSMQKSASQQGKEQAWAWHGGSSGQTR